MVKLNELINIYPLCDNWEKEFIQSIVNQKKDNKQLSVKQLEVIGRVIKKYEGVNKEKAKPIEFNNDLLNDYNLRDWQKEAIIKWFKSGGKGTVKAVTGAGKTMIGLMITKLVNGTKLIVVPTIALQKQWFKELVKFGYDKSIIGLVGGGKRELHDKEVVIAVVNSIRGYELNFNLLILDEVHRYNSRRNISFIHKSYFSKVLGLSATPILESIGFNAVIEMIAPIIFKYDYQRAKSEGIICPFDIINIGVDFSDEQVKKKYFEIDSELRTLMNSVGHNWSYIMNHLMEPDCAKILRLVNLRKQLIQNSVDKVNKAVELIIGMKDKKVIVFNELISSAELLKDKLESNGLKCAIYHSSIKGRGKMFKDFREGLYNILISVKALDEGVNVPEMDTAIIIGGNSTIKQMTQRVGRILRVKDGKHAKVYQIYLVNTKDAEWLYNRMNDLKKVAESVTWV